MGPHDEAARDARRLVEKTFRFTANDCRGNLAGPIKYVCTRFMREEEDLRPPSELRFAFFFVCFRGMRFCAHDGASNGFVTQREFAVVDNHKVGDNGSWRAAWWLLGVVLQQLGQRRVPPL